MKRPGRPATQRPRATIWDVARVAGVSAKTVSRVLNAEPGVAEATGVRVRAAIASLGFRRNEMARMLRTGSRVRAIGLVIDGWDDAHSAGIAGAVAKQARESGYLVVTGTSYGDPGHERQLVSWLLDRQVDGLLVAAAGEDYGYLAAELERGLPVVFIDQPPAGIEADCVIVDNVDGGRQATHHLLRHWHRRIAFIGNGPQIVSALQRLEGYREALTTGGIWVDPELIQMDVQAAPAARDAVQKLLALSNPPTAVVAAGSRLAEGAAAALDHSGIALVAFDDLGLIRGPNSTLTAVTCEAAAIGSSAISLLLEKLIGTTQGVRRTVLPVALTARGSGELRPGVAPARGPGRRWYRR